MEIQRRKLPKPTIEISGTSLEQANFTNMGKQKYVQIIQDVAVRLYQTSVKYADEDKNDLPREVTQEHLQHASSTMFSKYHSTKMTNGMIACQIGEYVFSAATGLGAGHITEYWGLALFVFSLCMATGLFVIRLTQFNS